jgi:hypothetical protein
MKWKLYKFIFNYKEFAKILWTKKLRIFHSFPTVYHLHHSDKQLKNYSQISLHLFWISPNLLFLKLFKNCTEFEKTSNIKKLRLLHIYPTPYYLHHSDKSLRKFAQIIVRPFLNRSEFQFFQNCLKSVTNLKKLAEITKLCNLNSFPMAYHMRYSDLWFGK